MFKKNLILGNFESYFQITIAKLLSIVYYIKIYLYIYISQLHLLEWGTLSDQINTIIWVYPRISYKVSYKIV